MTGADAFERWWAARRVNDRLSSLHHDRETYTREGWEAGSFLERARLREKVEAMLPASLRMVRPRVGGIFDDRPSIRFQAAEEGFEHAIAEVLALLAESGEGGA